MVKLDTKKTTFIPAWNGNRSENEPIRLELLRLSVEDYWKVAAIISYISDNARADISLLTAAKLSSHEEIMKDIPGIIGRYVVSIANLTVDDSPAKPSDLTRTAQLLPLVVEVLAELLCISTLDSVLKKRLEAPLSESPAQDMTA